MLQTQKMKTKTVPLPHVEWWSSWDSNSINVWLCPACHY